MGGIACAQICNPIGHSIVFLNALITFVCASSIFCAVLVSSNVDMARRAFGTLKAYQEPSALVYNLRLCASTSIVRAIGTCERCCIYVKCQMCTTIGVTLVFPKCTDSLQRTSVLTLSQ